MMAQLVEVALLVAIWRRGEPDALLTTPTKAASTPDQFHQLIADSGIVCSMSRSSNVQGKTHRNKE